MKSNCLFCFYHAFVSEAPKAASDIQMQTVKIKLPVGPFYLQVIKPMILLHTHTPNLTGVLSDAARVVLWTASLGFVMPYSCAQFLTIGCMIY